jgi:hypothetical protein
MNLTPEQLASVRAEEAKIAAKHSITHQADVQASRNAIKNKNLYAKLAKQVKSKTGGKSNHIRIFRQCPDGVEPSNFTLHQMPKVTYMEVQYFKNQKSGQCSNVLKICWSTHKDPKKAKCKEFQTKTYYNLYAGYKIAERTKPYGKETSKVIAQTCKQMNEFVDVSDDHPMQEVMYGYSTVQCEKRGTKNFLNFTVTVMPTEIDGKSKTILYFDSDGVKHEVLLHDVSGRRNKDGSERDSKASKMIGYLPSISAAKENQMLKEILQKHKNKGVKND